LNHDFDRRPQHATGAVGMSAFGRKAEIFCSIRALPILTRLGLAARKVLWPWESRQDFLQPVLVVAFAQHVFENL